MKYALLSAPIIIAALAIQQSAKAESPVPCKPGYVRSAQGGPCYLNVLATNRLKANTKSSRRHQRR